MQRFIKNKFFNIPVFYVTHTIYSDRIFFID